MENKANFDELRKQLIEILINENYTMRNLAKDLKISRPTLSKFLNDKAEQTFITMLKINQFVTKRYGLK